LAHDDLDKLAAAVYVLSFPSLLGAILLLFQGTRPFRYWWSYARLSALWLTSVALVGIGIFAQYGKFTHLTDFLAILHVQTEWLIMALLLSATATQAIVAATGGGFLLYLFLFALPGIKGTFFTTSFIGGFGDVFIPVLLLYGKQYALGLGGIGHFLNAYVSFRSFVQWTPVPVYLSLQLFAATLHAIGTVVGVRSNLVQAARARNGAIALREDDDTEETDESKTNPLQGANLTRSKVIKLALLSFGLSLIASIPINFWPRP
jgi:hypothetical protein